MSLCLPPAAGFEVASAANLEEVLGTLEDLEEPPLGFPSAKELLNSQTSLHTSTVSSGASSLILLSRLAVIKWSSSSCLPGDLALRIDTVSRLLVIEMMERGMKSLIRVPFDMVDLMLFEQREVGPDGGSSDAASADFVTECPGCGERFATDSHRLSHQQSCPLHRFAEVPSGGGGTKRPRSQQPHLVSVHMAFKEPPSFWREAEVDPLLPLQLVPCEDLTGGELSRTLQVSAHLRAGDDVDASSKLTELVETVGVARQALAQAIEESRYAAVLGAAVMKRFDDYGHFRGVVQGFQKPFFSICYADGDQEEVDARELTDLLVLPLPTDGSGKKRRRRRTLNHAPQKAVTRVGIEYQAVVPEFGTAAPASSEGGPALRGADLFEQTHAPSDDAPRAAAAIAAMKVSHRP